VKTKLESAKYAVFWSGFDADYVEQMDDDQKYAEHATNHHQTPWHLMRSLIFFPDCSEFGMRKHAKGNEP